MDYRLYESAGFLGSHSAFADSDDFDALRLWAVKYNATGRAYREGATAQRERERLQRVDEGATRARSARERPPDGRTPNSGARWPTADDGSKIARLRRTR